MGKTDDSTQQKLNLQLKLNKRISKQPIKSTLSPSSEAKLIYLNKQPFKDENNESTDDSVKQVSSAGPRKPLMDITNSKPNGSASSKKNDTTKYTKHYTYLNFLDKAATRQFKVCLYVDRELGIPQEYVHKLMDHTVDNDVATDDEQIQSAMRKLRGALEEEIFKKKELEEDVLEHVTFVEVERWELEAPARDKIEREKSLREFQLLLKNEKVLQPTRQPLEQLFERVFIAYQSTCVNPVRLKSHERLLYKALEKSVPKYLESFRQKSTSYRNYLQKRQQLLKNLDNSQKANINNNNNNAHNQKNSNFNNSNHKNNQNQYNFSNANSNQKNNNYRNDHTQNNSIIGGHLSAHKTNSFELTRSN